MQKSNIKGYLTAVLLLIITVTAAYLGLTKEEYTDQQQTQQTAFGGELIYTEGVVEHKTEGENWTRTKNGTQIQQGDSIETMSEARAIIKLDDGSVLRLNENSQLTLESLNPEHIIIQNNKGEIYSRVAKSDRIFQVVASSVTYESMGTAYKTIHTDKENGVEVYESKVKVKNNIDEVIVEQGEKYYDAKSGSFDTVRVVTELSEKDLQDEFTAWNLEKDNNKNIKITVEDNEEDEKEDEDEDKDEKATENKEEDEEEEEGSDITESQNEKKITITAKTDGAVQWTSNIAAENGYKVVWSKTENPTYPTRSTDKYIYYSSQSSRYAVIDAWDDTGIYFVRVCEYTGGACGTYSNQVQVKLTKQEQKEQPREEPKQEQEQEQEGATVNSISLSASGSTVNWQVNGTSSKGFKVVWSKSQNPTYPTRSTDKYEYYPSPTATSHTVTAFDGPGTYNVRVCEYTGGACGTYSNQVQVELQ